MPHREVGYYPSACAGGGAHGARPASELGACQKPLSEKLTSCLNSRVIVFGPSYSGPATYSIGITFRYFKETIAISPHPTKLSAKYL